MFCKAKSAKKNCFFARRFSTTSKQKCSNVRPLLSITFPQGFRIFKNIGHPISGSGGKKTVKRYLKSEQTHKQMDRRTNRRTFRLIESIGPEGTIKNTIKNILPKVMFKCDVQKGRPKGCLKVTSNSDIPKWRLKITSKVTFNIEVQKWRPRVTSKGNVQKLCLKWHPNVMLKSNIQKNCQEVTFKSDIQKWWTKVTYKSDIVSPVWCYTQQQQHLIVLLLALISVHIQRFSVCRGQDFFFLLLFLHIYSKICWLGYCWQIKDNHTTTQIYTNPIF